MHSYKFACGDRSSVAAAVSMTTMTLCSLEATDHLYDESSELSRAAATKARQTYTDTLKTLTDAESVELPTAANMSTVEQEAEDIRQQV